MKKMIIPALLASLLLPSCKELSDSDIQIVSGIACGWCAGADSLVLTRESTLYRVYNNCTYEVNHQYDLDFATDREDWNKLIASLDWSEFKRVDANSCGICVDGCDTYIGIKNNGEYHSIRYSAITEAELEPVLEFITRLDSIRSKLRSMSEEQ